MASDSMAEDVVHKYAANFAQAMRKFAVSAIITILVEPPAATDVSCFA